MNWNAIVAVSQLIAAVGVILSLIFVGLQIKQNTRALQRAEHNSTMEQWTVIRQAIAQNRDIALRPCSYRLGRQLYRKPYASAQCVRAAGDSSTLTMIK